MAVVAAIAVHELGRAVVRLSEIPALEHQPALHAAVIFEVASDGEAEEGIGRVLLPTARSVVDQHAIP